MRYLLIVALVLLLAGASPCFALTWGVKAGVSISDLRNDFVVDDLDSKTGVTAGALVAHQLGPFLGVQAEVNYVQKGAKSTQLRTNELGENVGQFDDNINIDYLEIPVLVKITYFDGAVSALVGPSLAIRVNSSRNFQGAGLEDEFNMPDVRDTDLGILFGFAGAIPVGKNKVTLDVRYTHGLIDITDDEATSTVPGDFPLGPTSQIKNRGVTLLAGVTF